MKKSMLSRLVFGLIIMFGVLGGDAETASSLEGLGSSALILVLIAEIAGVYLGVYLFLKGMKDAVAYIKS